MILSLPSLPQFYYITFFNICQGSGRRASPADLLSVFPTEVFQGTTKTADANANALCPKFFFPSFSNYIISHFWKFVKVRTEMLARSALSAKIRAYAAPGRESELGTKNNFGNWYPIGEARTFHEKNRIWGTRPENRPWRPSAAGRVSLG